VEKIGAILYDVQDISKVVEDTLSKYEVDEKELEMKEISKIEKQGDKLKIFTRKTHEVVVFLADYAKSSNNKIMSLNTLKPNLEDVFVELTEKKEKVSYD